LLTLVPTPIGNLADISFRAKEAIEKAEIVFCEDTRVSKRLISLLQDRYNLQSSDKKFISLHSHNELAVLQKIDISIFEKNVIYLSDAGMPCVSDPGAKLVAFCQENRIKYDVLPGANAVLTAFAMSGFDEKEFVFFGFLAHKGKKREDELSYLLNQKFNTILYESPHRVLKCLEDICKIDDKREVFLVKEITKLNQKSFKGEARELLDKLKLENLKGEWSVVIKGKELIFNQITKEDVINLDIPKKVKAKLLSKITNLSTKECYDNLIN